MKLTFSVIMVLIIFFAGCKDNPVVPEDQNNSGSIVLKIDRANAPASVVTVIAKLTRGGYSPITSEMNLLSDSTADLNMNNVPVGQWHLKIDAKNQAGVIEYTGETDITVIQNTVIQVTLTLYPVSGSTGGIHIFVTWGTTGSIWKDAQFPVMLPSHNPSNPLYVTQAKVIYDDGVYKMWYNALYNNAVASIWYAESQDGNTWTTIGNEPVLTKSEYGWDSYTVSVLHVFKEDDLYKMYYHGFDAHPFNTSWKIGYATSVDGKIWQKHPQPVMTESGQYFRIGLTSVVKHNNIYYGYICYFNYSLSNSYIGAATSTDGINWTFINSNPILSATTAWEGMGVFYPTVIYDDEKFKMVYSNRTQTSLGHAESATPFNFIKETKPIFTPDQSYYNWQSIAYPNYIEKAGEYRVYYSGFKNNNNTNALCYISKQ
jgi:predicted GH43/DUF377 family glycosyl hydrolase